MEIPFSRKKSSASLTLLKSLTVPFSFPPEVQSARSLLRKSMYRESRSGRVGSFACSQTSSNAARFSFRPESQLFRLCTICRIDCIRLLAVLISRFRFPTLVFIPRFSIWLTAAPM